MLSRVNNEIKPAKDSRTNNAWYPTATASTHRHTQITISYFTIQIFNILPQIAVFRIRL